MKKTPSIPDLFDSPAVADTELVRIDAPTAALSREQRTFNRLTGEIEKKRRQLEEWRTFLNEFDERMRSRLQPLVEKHYGIELSLVRRLDAMLGSRTDVRLNKRERELLSWYLVQRLHELLDGDTSDTDELNEMLLRHSGEDIHALREEEQALERELTESMLGSLFGEEVLEDFDGDDVEGLFQHVHEKVRAREAERLQAGQPSGAASVRKRRPNGARRPSGKPASRCAMCFASSPAACIRIGNPIRTCASARPS